MTTTTSAPNNKQLAMSKALGAAFLNHQVEQLEKSVGTNPTSPNWRDRDRRGGAGGGRGRGRGGGDGANGANGHAMKRSPQPQRRQATWKKGGPGGGGEFIDQEPGVGFNRRKSSEEKGEKNADVIVVDSSVLVHALYQVKKWCKDGREEVLIVPLEALNTLDLLKKGTTPLAQRARAASRILEAQVGTNPRIKVQSDDAFVLWDKIAFTDAPVPAAEGGSPEWLRRTICCARWEMEQGEKIDSGEKKKKVVFAVLATNPPQNSIHPHQPTRSDESASPVPLPAPAHPHHAHTTKYEPRTSGILVHSWASRAGLEMISIAPSAPAPTNSHANPNLRVSSEEERTGRGRKASVGGPGLVERPPAVMAMMEMVSNQPGNSSKGIRVLARGEKLDPET